MNNQQGYVSGTKAGSDTELRVGDFLAPSLSRVTQEHAWHGENGAESGGNGRFLGFNHRKMGKSMGKP